MPTSLSRRHLPPPIAVSALGIVAPPPIHVETRHFTGSLAALFEVVRAQKVNLLDIPLQPICEAYFAYLAQAARKDIDEAAAALVALAYLLERKAWALLPVAEPEPDLDDAVALPIGRLDEFAAAMEALRIYEEERSHLHFRSADGAVADFFVPMDIGELQPADLARALDQLLEKAKPDPIEPLGKPRRSLSEQMGLVFEALDASWRELPGLLPEDYTRSEAVWWFLALLELIRLGQARVKVDEKSVVFSRSGR